MPTIGVVFPGDGRRSDVRSGVPYSLAAGLQAAGAEIRHVRAEPAGPLGWAARQGLTALELPRALRRGNPRAAWNLAYNGPRMGRLQSIAAGRRIRSVATDGLVQVGSSYALPAGNRVVTHDDMTVVQALRAGYETVCNLSPEDARARVERQRVAFERAHACCVVTRWAGQSIIEDYGIPPEKIRVVGGGRNHEPRALPRDWTRPRFLFVGKDWERKNGPAVLRAFARLRADIPEAQLDLVGGHPAVDAPGVTPYGALALDDPADRTRLDHLFETATCFVLPSRHEPSGIVFSEANAAGVPSIGSTEGGSGELIGDAGRVVHPDDEDALLSAMTELANPETAERLGENARRRSRLFTWPMVGQRVLRALDVQNGDSRPLADFL